MMHINVIQRQNHLPQKHNAYKHDAHKCDARQRPPLPKTQRP